MLTADYQDLGQGDDYVRACKAYHRFQGPQAPIPGNSDSGEIRVGDRHYVRLANVNGILAVYRVTRTNRLKALKRWPQVLEEW